MGTISDENERFGLVFMKTTVFMLKTGFKNPSTGINWETTQVLGHTFFGALFTKVMFTF